MSKKHTDALKAKTQEITAFATKTFITIAKYPAPSTVKPALPYIVWHPAQGENEQTGVTGPRVRKSPRFTGHIVGEDADQVQVLLDLLEAKLFPDGRGITLTVTGERSKPLWFSSPLPIQVQTDPQPTIVYAVVEVGWSADPE
jgi:hypothetical protein